MRLLLFLLISSSAWSLGGPLSLAVSGLENRYECTIEYPEEIQYRKTEAKGLQTLKSALSAIFYKESYSISKKDGKTLVKVLKKSVSSLGNIGSQPVSPVTVKAGNGDIEVDSSSLLVSFPKGFSESQKVAKLNSYGLKYDVESLARKVILVGTNGQDLKKVASNIQSDQSMKMTYNHIVKTAVDTSVVSVNLAEIVLEDPFYNQQWGHQAVKGHIGYLDEKKFAPKIVVLDTGLSLSHPDISTNHVSNRDFGDTILEDNDANGHGTAVVGIIGAAWNGEGITGLTKTDVISVKVFDH